MFFVDEKIDLVNFRMRLVETTPKSSVDTSIYYYRNSINSTCQRNGSRNVLCIEIVLRHRPDSCVLGAGLSRLII